jgi:predicted phage replisome organizer
MIDNKSKKYTWLKQSINFFTEPQIKKLRKVAGGDTYTIILQKIMLLSIKNEGVIVYEKIEPTIEEELALILDEEVENIKMTWIFMLKSNIIECIENDKYLLPSVIPLIGSETDAAERMRRMRAKQITIQECNNVTPMLQNVTQSKRREDKDKDIELELELSFFDKNEQENIKNWIEYKKERKHTYKKIGLNSLLTQLKEHKTKGCNICQAIQITISNNWSGIVFDKGYIYGNQIKNIIADKLKNISKQDFNTGGVF